jgi:pimeloyl-ACP methyl ester carboxylesterase
MWALCLALDSPDRVSSVVAVGMPAVALPGVRADPFFRLLTVPWLGRVAARVLPTPKSVKATRRGMKGVVGNAALETTPDEFFALVSAGMRVPGWREAMWTHLNVALRFGRARPDQVLDDVELRSIGAPVLFIWGKDDVYGRPEIGRRAVELIPDARLEIAPGNHAPFLNDPQRCASLIEEMASRDRRT